MQGDAINKKVWKSNFLANHLHLSWLITVIRHNRSNYTWSTVNPVDLPSQIKEDPFLKSTLASLSYPSFAKLLDMFADENEAPVPTQSDSTTLSHIAVTMEASRRILTANGTQRMQGYAERYMQKFVPLVQSQGGWVSRCLLPVYCPGLYTFAFLSLISLFVILPFNLQECT